MAWIMGTLAATAAVAAVGVTGWGIRSTPGALTPRTETRPSAGRDEDPLAPRLFDQSGPIRVHVAGAVKKPGVYSLPAWARVIDAVKKAGGATASAALDRINLADPVRDGEQVRIPVRGRAERLEAHHPT